MRVDYDRNHRVPGGLWCGPVHRARIATRLSGACTAGLPTWGQTGEIVTKIMSQRQQSGARPLGNGCATRPR
jgi:hypothetical protein